MNMLKGLATEKGVDFLMNRMPENIQNFINKTGITDKQRLKRLFDGKPLESDIHLVSQDTLRLLAPYVLEAIAHLSTEVGMQVVFCLAVRDGEIKVKVIEDKIEPLEIEGASFPFEYLVTAILAKVQEAKTIAVDASPNSSDSTDSTFLSSPVQANEN